MGRVIILYLVLVIGIFSCQKKDEYEDIKKILAETKLKFATDSRTTIFDVEIVTSKPVTLQGETNLRDAKTSLLKQLQLAGFDIQDQITMLPSEEIGKEIYGVISISVANLRSQAKHSSELVTQSLLGTPVNILKQSNGWLLIQTPDQYIAWTNSESLARMNQEQLSEWKKSPKIIYLNTYGFSLDTLGKERVSDLVAGNILRLAQENDDFWKVTYPDGRKALISKKEAENYQSWYTNIMISGQSIKTAAMDLTGVPYLWGGTSTKGVDCSGFTKTVYFLHGLILPRDASQQVLIGDLIDTEKSFSSLNIGDLLFFGKVQEDQSEKVVHVGLWLGNNKFIHASGDVHISSMDSLDANFDQYNYNRYLRSKRIISAQHSPAKSLSSCY